MAVSISERKLMKCWQTCTAGEGVAPRGSTVKLSKYQANNESLPGAVPQALSLSSCAPSASFRTPRPGAPCSPIPCP